MSAALPLKRLPDAPHPPILLPSPLRWRPASVWPLVTVQALLGVWLVGYGLFAALYGIRDYLNSLWDIHGVTLLDVSLRFGIIFAGIGVLSLARLLPQGDRTSLIVARWLNWFGGIATLARAGWQFHAALHDQFGYFLQVNYEFAFNGLLLVLIAAAWLWAAFRARRLQLEQEYSERPLQIISTLAPHSDAVPHS